ncbi:MAG: hypothetical protein QXG48_04715 [Thermofilaceae archaeon]
MRAERSKAAQGGVDLTAFFTPSSGDDRQKAKAAHQIEGVKTSEDLEAALRGFLKERGGRATKTELYEWAKRKNIPPAPLYSTISRMIAEGRMIKRFDDGSRELVYELSSK